VSLEEPFWDGLKEISESRNMTLSGLIGEIDGNRHQGNLSSTIRLFVLDYFKGRVVPCEPGVREGEFADIEPLSQHGAGLGPSANPA